MVKCVYRIGECMNTYRCCILVWGGVLKFLTSAVCDKSGCILVWGGVLKCLFERNANLVFVAFSYEDEYLNYEGAFSICKYSCIHVCG